MSVSLLYSGDKIKQLRTAKGWSMVELGKAAGVSHVTISKYERGIVGNRGAYSTLASIAIALGVPLQAVLAENQSPDLDDNLAEVIAGLDAKNKAALLGAAISLLKKQS